MASVADGPGTNVAPLNTNTRRRCVVVGLGMVEIAFVEKLLLYDLEGGRDEWEVTV